MTQLTRTERLILANQYRILRSTDPSEAEFYEKALDALESGYELAIESLFDSMSEDLDVDECRLVVNAMAVYDAIQRSVGALEDKSVVDDWHTKFHGFDGNNETAYMTYARFIINREDRFTYLKLGDDGVNSHMPRVETYRAMVRKWKEDFDGSYAMNADQLRELLSIRQA
jgi:uncharacterized protein YfbU (UPF0304 family)